MKFDHSQSHFSGTAIDDLSTFHRFFFFTTIVVHPKPKKKKRDSKSFAMSNVLKIPLTFATPLTSMTTRLDLQNIIWHLSASLILKCQSKNNSFKELPLFFVVIKTMIAHINDTMLIPMVAAALRHIFCVLRSERR